MKKEIKKTKIPKAKLSDTVMTVAEHHEEMKRYIGSLTEEFKDRVSAVAEQMGGVLSKLDEHGKKLDMHTDMIGNLAVDVTMVKEEIKEMQGTLDEHTKILGEHSKILGEHSKILGEHSKSIGELSSDVKEIKKVLEEKADKKAVVFRIDQEA